METEPEILFNEVKQHRGSKKLNKLELAGMNVLEFELKEGDVIKVTTPKFVFTSNFHITHLAFFVYHSTCHEFYGEKRIRQDHDLVFYPLDKSDFLVKTKTLLKDHYYLTILLKKVLANGFLYFKIETCLKILPKKEYHLPLVPDGRRSDLGWVYTYLEMFSHNSVNGSFVGSRKEETQLSVIESGSQRHFELERKNASVLAAVLIFFCAVISLFVFSWVRKTYLKRNKLRFQKDAKITVHFIE